MENTKSLRSILIAGVAAFALVACLGLVGCGSNGGSSSGGNGGGSAAPAPSDDEAAGFDEIPIGEDQEIAFMNVAAVYFQPVPMVPGQESIEGFDMHLEADISALDGNDLGYEAGGWVPYLTVDYKIIGSDDKVATSGTFMNMAASDGPHYGANVALPKADTYSLEITIHDPSENGYLVHTGETGPGGVMSDYFGDGNLVVTFEGWEYTPQEWE